MFVQKKYFTHPLAILTFFCLFKVLISFAMTAVLPLGFSPDEAHYWLWSKHLDYSYYSKPGGIAWQIKWFSYWWGDSETALRAGVYILGAMMSYAIYALAIACRQSPKTALISALIAMFCPVGFLAGFALSTDGGYILFWIMACLFFIKAIEKPSSSMWIWVCLSIILGAQFKWAIYFFWGIAFLYTLFFARAWIFSCVITGCVSLIGLAPAILWNARHQWVTFRHVIGHNFQLGSQSTAQGNFGDFVGAQIGFFSPVFFILAVVAVIVTLYKKPPLTGIMFCAFCSGIMMVGFSCYSLVKKVQPNWGLGLYPTSFILIGYYLKEKLSRHLSILLSLGFGLSILTLLIVFAVPFTQTKVTVDPPFTSLSKINIFKQQMGWSHLQKALKEVGFNPKYDVLASNKYQISSLLAYYAPATSRVYYLNIDHNRANQFDFWESLADCRPPPRVVYFVFFELLQDNVIYSHAFHKNLLKPYFKEVKLIKEVPLVRVNKTQTKQAIIFKCIGYQGKHPEAATTY